MVLQTKNKEIMFLALEEVFSLGLNDGVSAVGLRVPE